MSAADLGRAVIRYEISLEEHKAAIKRLTQECDRVTEATKQAVAAEKEKAKRDNRTHSGAAKVV